MFLQTQSAREWRLWLWAGGLLLAIYGSAYSVRPVAEWLRGRGLLRIFILALFLAVAAAILVRTLRKAPGWRELAVLGLFSALYLAVLWPIRIPEERFHLLQYGLLAAVVYAALLERHRPGDGMGWSAWPALLAAAVCGLAGWLDEGIQHLLPNRYFGWRDVGLNLLAAVLAIAALAALAEARRADRGAIR